MRETRSALTLSAALLLAAVTPSAGTAQAASDPGGLEARVDSLMADYDSAGSPGGVVGVIREGEVAFAKGYGSADLAHGIPITPGTRFNVGSVSKQYLGYAFAMLDARGELSLDDPVADHLEDWPTFEDTVRIRHLLTHTSGYREAYGTLALAGRNAGEDLLPRSEALEVVRRQPALEFPAGSDWQYNSTAYVVLAEILENVTGQPAAAWVTEHLLRPLGMEETVIETDVGQVVPRAADSYTDREGGGYLREVSNRAIFGAAEVFTTVGDAAKWYRNLHTAEVGGPEARERFLEPFVLTGGDTTGYALGIRVDEHRGLRRLRHGGSHAGYRTQFVYYPGPDAGVVVMSNYDGVDVGDVAISVAEHAFGDRMAPEEETETIPTEVPDSAIVELRRATLAAYAGTYRAEDGDLVAVELRGDTLTAEGRFRLLPLADTLFHVHGAPVRVAFRRAEDGSVAGVTVDQPGGRQTFRRLEPWDPGPAELEAYAGAYWSPELETLYTLAAADSGMVARHRWEGRIPLRPVDRDHFRSEDGIRVRFERNEVGVVTGLYATTGRTRDVWFRKRE